MSNKVKNVWRFLLTVAVDPAISLLKHHERPGDVKMDQMMAEIMKIDMIDGFYS